MKISKLVVFASLSVMTTLAQAAVFTDNFNSYGEAVPWVTPLGGWSYTGKGVNVDLVQNNTYGISVSNADGFFVDLIGTPGTTTFTNSVSGLTVGETYNLTFDLAGNNRVSSLNDDLVTVTFGTSAQDFSSGSWNSIFSTYTLSYTATDTTASFSFTDKSGVTNVGTLLDNVTVAAAVPEPETYGMMTLGLGLIGFMVRRRKDEQA